MPDIRNSKAVDIVRELEGFGMKVQVTDPLADAAESRQELGIELKPLDQLAPADAVVFAVAHEAYVSGGWSTVSRLLEGGRGVVMDVRCKLDRAKCPPGVELWRM